MAVEFGEPSRSIAAPGQREQHARGGIQPRIQSRQHGREHHGVHDLRCGGNSHGDQRTDVRRAHGGGIPRHEAHHQKNRAHIEEQHPHHNRVGRRGHRFRRFGGLRRRDGDDFGAEVESGGRDGTGQHRQYAVGRKSAMRREIGQVRRGSGPQSEYEHASRQQEYGNSRDLDRGEPKLEFAVRAYGKDIREREQQHQT